VYYDERWEGGGESELRYLRGALEEQETQSSSNTPLGGLAFHQF
jgi:hypothetical protein